MKLNLPLTPGAYLAAFFAFILAIPLIGNALPPRHSSYIPMMVGNDFIRDEFVRRFPLAEMPTPCVAFFGDSRTAFNISGEVIDRSLPNGCRSQNFGFASLTLRKIKRLASDLPTTETIVVSVSETMLTPPGQEWSRDAVVEIVLETSWIRQLYLGHQRFVHLCKTLIKRRPPDTGWDWSAKEKRWHFRGLRSRVMVQLQSHDQDASAMADNYFKVRNPGGGAELTSLLTWLSARTGKLIVVIPPSEKRFQEFAEHYGGKQRLYWQIIAKAVVDAGATLIDCSNSCVEQSGFADPVHLNDYGAVAYSENLARRLAPHIVAERGLPLK